MSQEQKKEQWIRTEIRVVQKIKMKPKTVWRIISAVGGVQNWVPMIKDCRLEGRGVGAYRICTTANGIIREVIDKIEHRECLFEYSIVEQSIMPFHNFKGTIKVTGKSEEFTEIQWKGAYDISECFEKQMKIQLQEMFEQAIQGLDRFSRTLRDV